MIFEQCWRVKVVLSVLLVAAGILHGLQGGVVIGSAGCAAGLNSAALDHAHRVAEDQAPPQSGIF